MRSGILFFLVLTLHFSVFAYDWGTNPGDGSEENPYQISEPNHLMSIGSDATLLDKHFILTSDIFFDPISNPSHVFDRALIAPDTSSDSDFQGTPFSGSLNGNWHSVYGLKITGNSSFSGFFGKIQGISGTTIIENIFIINPFVSAIREVGSLAGCLSGGIVENCFIYNGEVIARYRGGGMIGFNESGLLKNACYEGLVALPDLTGGHDIGGLVGRNNDEIDRCFTIVDLNVMFDAGGLVGWNEGLISNCYSQGTLSGFRYIGGLVGVDNSEEALIPAISNCYTSTEVNFESSSAFLAGGFVGIKRFSTYKNCFWNTTLNPELTGIGDNLSDPNIIGLSMQQMKQQSNFTNWDFLGESTNGSNDIWRMCIDGVDYPRLSLEFAQNGDFACGDGVDILDLQALAEHWLFTEVLDPTTFSYACDANGDGVIDLLDYSVLGENW